MHALSRFLPRRLAAAAIAVATLAGAAPAIAAYPERPINLVVPMPPGGGTDVVSRLLAERLGVATGWNLVVQNKPGATGNIGMDYVAQMCIRDRPRKWSFSSGWKLASTRASATCYVWSNSAPFQQHCPWEAQRFPRRLTQFLGKLHSAERDILRS